MYPIIILIATFNYHLKPKLSLRVETFRITHPYCVELKIYSSSPDSNDSITLDPEKQLFKSMKKQVKSDLFLAPLPDLQIGIKLACNTFTIPSCNCGTKTYESRRADVPSDPSGDAT